MDSQIVNWKTGPLCKKEHAGASHLRNKGDVSRKRGAMGRKILIVDDDASISRMLQDLLIGEGYAVVSANNGREGLRAVEAHSIDGILLDLEMPVMDGWTMLDELRWRNDDVPVIVMSGGVPAASMRGLMREGAQGFLMKPFQLEELQRRCRQIFGPPVTRLESVPVLSVS